MTNVKEARKDRLFGRGDFLGDSGDVFFESSLLEKAMIMGWSHACAVIEATIEGYGGGTEGLVKTIKRYAECNFMFGLVKEEAQVKPELLQQLVSPVTRLKNEHLGEVEAGLYPPNYKYEMSPLSTPWGYSIPRVLIEVIRSAGDDKKLKAEKQLLVMQIINDVVPKAKTPAELAVRLAEAAINNGGNPLEVLTHLLAPGKLKEENCRVLMGSMRAMMPKYAPNLNEIYGKLHPHEREEIGIADY